MVSRTLLRATLLVAFLSACAGARSQETSARVADLLQRLKSEDPKERIRATEELGRLGRRAIPLLESQQAGDPEVRFRIDQAISKIRNTDPFFLVHSHERRTSTTIKEETLANAHAWAFSAFPVAVELSDALGRPGPASVSLTLDKANLWEVAERFALASGTSLDADGNAGVRLVEGKQAATMRIRRQGRFLASARSAGRRIVVKLHAEPGLQPVRVSFELKEASTSDGRSLRNRTTADSVRLQYGAPFPAATLSVLTLPEEKLPAGTTLRIEGTAVVDLAKEIDAVEFRRDGRVPETRSLGDSRLTVSDFAAEGSSFKVTLSVAGARGATQSAWLIVADDDGRSLTIGTVALGGSTEQSLQGAWNWSRPATRLCMVRAVEVESVQVPVVLEGVAVGGD